MTETPLVLGFDTSGPYCSATLLQGTAVVADLHEDMPRGQGETLFPLLEDLLQRGGAAWRDLNAIGVGIGPGNFTGIRISVSAARGLALSLDIPAVGVSLLEAAALGQNGPVLACLSAPRDQAYLQGFDTQAMIAPALHVMADIPRAWAEPGLTCVGQAADAVSDHLGAVSAPATYAPGEAVAHLAAARWQNGPSAPSPLYLKPADAAPARDRAPVILDDDA